MAAAPKTSKTRLATRKQIEKNDGVSKRRANQILAEGVDIRQSKAEKEFHTARLREMQAARAELELEAAKGRYILLADAEVEFRTMGEMVKATLRSWTAMLPGRLEGLTAAQMVAIFQDETDAILNALANGDPSR